jgi:hypothetical protein
LLSESLPRGTRVIFSVVCDISFILKLISVFVCSDRLGVFIRIIILINYLIKEDKFIKFKKLNN